MPNAIIELKKYQQNVNLIAEWETILGAKVFNYLASVVNLVAQSEKLQACSPVSIMSAAKIAATLDLPIDRSLGFAAIVPYGNEAQFQMQYKGLIQLAIRSGNYKHIMATEIYQDEFLSYDAIKEIFESTDQKNHKQRLSLDDRFVAGFYGRFELHNGFTKESYITVDQAFNHAKMYSKSYQYDIAQNKQSSV